MGAMAHAASLAALVALLFINSANGAVQMSISTYENTPLLDYSAARYLLPQLPATPLPASIAADYLTQQAWPPIMRGTLRTDEVIHSSVVNGTLVFELKCLSSKADVSIVGNQYTLVPRVGENGPDVFTYTVRQMMWDTVLKQLVMVEGTQEETNQVTLTILPVNQPPESTFDTQLAVVVSSTLGNNKLEPATGLDVDGHIVTYRLLTVPQFGTFRFVAGNNFTATGDSTFVYTSGTASGTDILQYEVDDCSENADLKTLADQALATGGWNRMNCMLDKGATRGQIQIAVTSTDALPDVDVGAVTLDEDQAGYPQCYSFYSENICRSGALTRSPTPDPASDPFLRFVMRTPPTLGSVQFLCAKEYAPGVDNSGANWTTMAAGQYCESHWRTNGTHSQDYRFRPTLNVNGADSFSFGLQGIGTMSSKTPPADRSIAVTILPTNDAPTLPKNRTVVVGHYIFRDTESAWKDPLLGNASATPKFTTVTFDVTSIDGERVMLANVTIPTLGHLYTTLTVDGLNVNLSSAYNASALLNMTLDAASATNYTTKFNVTLYYVPPQGYRGSPVASVNWYAWDGNMTRSQKGDVLLQVLCPLGFYKKVNLSAGNVTYSECTPCAAGTFSPVEDVSRCTPAAAGYYTTGGTGRQVACPAGTYSDVTGGASCTTCPLNRGGDTTVTSTTPGAASTSVAACVCAAAEVTSAFPYGYYGRPGESCHYCEDDLGWSCTENNLTLPMPKFGFWIDVCQPYPAKKRQCFPELACEAIVAANVSTMFQTNENVSSAVACAKLPVPDIVDGTCEDGFDQMACSACMRPGFYRLEGGCRKCPETDGTMTMIFIAIGVIIAAPILFKLSEQMKNFPSINIGISFSQYLGLFSVQIEYPESLRRLLSGFSFFNLNMELIHPECSMEGWNFSKKWQVMSLMPFAVFMLLAIAVAAAGLLCAYNTYVGAKVLEKNPDLLKLASGQKPGMMYRFKRMMILGMSWNQFVLFARKAIRAQLTFFQVAYMFLSSSAFELFDCTRNGSDGLYYLDSEPSVRCGWPHAPNDTATQEWLDIYQYAVATIVLYPVGIFILFTTLLHMIRYSLDSDGARTVLGFFYHRYEKQWYWYELVQLAKKVGLVAILSLMPDGNTSLVSRKTCCSIALVTVVTLMHFYAAPYESSNLDNMMSMALGTEFLLLFSGLIFLTDKLSPQFRLALTVLNVLVIIIAVCFLVVFIMLDVAPGMVAKLRKTWADRKNQKERTEKKKKLALEKKERKAKGLKDENKQLSIYAQFKLFSFIKRCLVSAQAARFFNPRATDAVATIRTAWGQKRVRELAKRGEIEQPPDVSKEDLKSMFNKLQKRTEKRESFSIRSKIDPTFSDFLKDTSKSSTLEGLATEDISENHHTDHFFEKLMLDMHPMQQKAAMKGHWFTRTVTSIAQGRSTWKRKRPAMEKLQALEAQGLLKLNTFKRKSGAAPLVAEVPSSASADDASFTRLSGTAGETAVETLSSEDNADNDSGYAGRSSLQSNPEPVTDEGAPPGTLK